MNDALLMGVLDRLANLDEQLESVCSGELVLVAVIGDFYSTHQLHDEEWAAGVGRPSIQHPGNVGMVHHRQSLTLGFKAGDHLACVHSQLNHLQRDAAVNGLLLLRNEDSTAPALPDFLQNLIPAKSVTRPGGQWGLR